MLVSAREAAKILKVDPKTVKTWVKNGRLKGTILRIMVEKTEVKVESTSLVHAFESKCLWCGKIFTSRHPGLARYCCRKHKDLYLYRAKKNGDPTIRRFKKTR